MAHGSVGILPLPETAEGMYDACALAKASPRVKGIHGADQRPGVRRLRPRLRFPRHHRRDRATVSRVEDGAGQPRRRRALSDRRHLRHAR